MVTQEEHDLAKQRADEIHRSGRYITDVRYDAATKTVHVAFKAGFTISFAKERCQVTANASDEQLSVVEISPAGWSADFPLIDDGLTAEGLLAGRFGNRKWEEAWAAAHTEPQAA